MWHSLKLLPKNHISWLFGRIMSVRLPAPVNGWVVKAFAKMTGANLEEASLPAERYRSLSEFFVRDLKPGSRPVPDNEKVVLSPVDGCLRNAGGIIDSRIPQVKGKDYGIADFLGDAELARKFEKGSFFNLYLSPRVEVIEADASTFVPPEPVDVVICEMLHSALLREKQIAVIDSFKKHYLARFPGKLPIFVPEATILAVQPVQQDFTFYGYKAPLPIFYQPTIEHVETAGLGDPVLYSVIEYKKDLPLKYSCNAEITINPAGILNGFRFITKNILAILIDKNATIDWHNFYLIVPLKDPVRVNAGDRFKLEFSYEAGGSIDSLTDSLRITNL